MMLTKRTVPSVLFAVLIAGLASPSFAQNADDYPLTPIHFPAGASSATISDGVERGASATYSFGAKTGQMADIELSSTESNGVFMIYLPGATTKKADGGIDVEGPVLPGIDASAGATKWSGTLPADGDYIITVVGTRGNVDYDLTVSVK